MLILSYDIILDVDLDHLAEVVFLSFLLCEVIPLLYPFSIPFSRKSYSSWYHWREGMVWQRVVLAELSWVLIIL